MKIPFSTTNVQGFNELKQILTNLKVEDLCLTRQGWENRGILVNGSDNGRTTKQSQYVNMQGLSIDVEDIWLTCIGLALNVFQPEQIMHAIKYYGKDWIATLHLRYPSRTRTIVIAWVPR